MKLPKLLEFSGRLKSLARRFMAREPLDRAERLEMVELWNSELRANGLISQSDWLLHFQTPIDTVVERSIVASFLRPPDPFIYPIPDWPFVEAGLAKIGGSEAGPALLHDWKAAESKHEANREDWIASFGAAPTAGEWWQSVKERFAIAEQQLARVGEPMPPAGQEGMPYPLTEAQEEAFFGEES